MDHPVTCISWYDAIAFCQWAGVCLPSEAEWEKAASWAAKTQTKRTFPLGNDKPDARLCNFNMNVKETTPVDAYPSGASPYGCLDMAGNVWGWTSSSWGKELQGPEFGYPYDATDGREDLDASYFVRRVLRGGSFYGNRNSVRCANRDGDSPHDRDYNVGFRVVRLGASKGI